ncbi:MAG: iron ABC transporter permease [Anaerolineaceae bacterium]|nr:iron ABC transporter permease [Anaerolineaceae bacterium]
MASLTSKSKLKFRNSAQTYFKWGVYGAGLIIFILLLFVVIYPSYTLVKNSFIADDHASFNNYIALFTSQTTFIVFRNTFIVAFWGAIGATAIGVLIAWLLARTDIPFKKFWRTALIIPYLIPPFIGAIAWVYLLGPVGYINKIWMAVANTFDPLWVIYGRGGIIFVMILYSYPIAYMVTLGPLAQMNPALEEAGQISGAGTLRTLRDITLPLMLPSIGGSALLIFMSMMANFGIPAVIGFPKRYFVMTTQIFLTILNFDRANNLQIAAALSMLLVFLAIITMQLQRWVQRGKSFAIISGKSSQPQLIQLKNKKYVAVVFLGLLVLLTVALPVLSILATSLLKALGLPFTFDNLSFVHYQRIFTELPKAQRAIKNSFLLATGSATAIVFIALIISYLVVKLKVKWGMFLEALVILPYAVPGIVVALAMILAFVKPLPLVNISLYNTIWIIAIAYIARFLTFGVRSISAAFEQVHGSLEDAARISGADFVSSFKDIVIPLIKSNIFAGWFLAFSPALTELTLSMLLFSVGNETLGTVVFGLHQEGKVGMTAALSLIVMIFVVLLNILTNKITKGKLGF